MSNRYFNSRTRDAWIKALAGGVKAKPHSTAVGRTAAAKRRLLRGISKPQTSPLMPFKPKMPKALGDKLKKLGKK